MHILKRVVVTIFLSTLPAMNLEAAQPDGIYAAIDEKQLNALEAQIENDLVRLNVPTFSWIIHSDSDVGVLDVAIIGGGMAGIAACFALIKEGVSNIKIFDENPENQEGPWIKYARMDVLRSGKRFLGPALGIPSLTFSSWYEACYGKERLQNLWTSPTRLWHNYLCWFRKVLKLPIENDMKLINLQPYENLLELTFNHGGRTIIVYARKVVLATGREGSGGYEIPPYLNEVPKRLYAHTAEIIDPQFFKNKRIAIIGAASSAFDAAAAALENGAQTVEMIVRRSAISAINKFGQFAYPGLENGFYLLSDEMKCSFFAQAFKAGGVAPSIFAVKRVKDFNNLHFHYNSQVQQVVEDGDALILQTNLKSLRVDFIIVATGYRINLFERAELDAIRHTILLWKDRVADEFLREVPMLGLFPYLGSHFQFMEMQPGSAPFLKNIYCFNYGASLSHGLVSGDIPGVSVGAMRLAKGIAADFFVGDSTLHLEQIRDWQTPDFNVDDYPVLMN